MCVFVCARSAPPTCYASRRQEAITQRDSAGFECLVNSCARGLSSQTKCLPFMSVQLVILVEGIIHTSLPHHPPPTKPPLSKDTLAKDTVQCTADAFCCHGFGAVVLGNQDCNRHQDNGWIFIFNGSPPPPPPQKSGAANSLHDSDSCLPCHSFIATTRGGEGLIPVIMDTCLTEENKKTG